MSDPSNDEDIEWKRGDPTRRCTTIKKDGRRCRKWAIRGGTVCTHHGGSAAQVRAKARERVEQTRLAMMDKSYHNYRNLQDLADNSTDDNVRLRANSGLLDRVGLGGKQSVEVEVELKPWEQMLEGIATISREESRARRGLATEPRALAGPEEPLEVVDAELVEEYPDDPPHGRARGPVPADRGDGPTPRPHFAEGAPSRPPGTGLQTMEDALSDLRDGRQR